VFLRQVQRLRQQRPRVDAVESEREQVGDVRPGGIGRTVAAPGHFPENIRAFDVKQRRDVKASIDLGRESLEEGIDPIRSRLLDEELDPLLNLPAPRHSGEAQAASQCLSHGGSSEADQVTPLHDQHDEHQGSGSDQEQPDGGKKATGILMVRVDDLR